MLREFFEEKCRRDHALNECWIHLLEKWEHQLTDELRLAFSRILNAHHIWNSRLQQQLPESEMTDLMPLSHWRKLQELNFRETLNYLEDVVFDSKVHYHDSEGVRLEQTTVDMLFQLLQENQFYRGQLALLFRQAALEAIPPAFGVLT